MLPLNPDRLGPLRSPCLGMPTEQSDKSVPVQVVLSTVSFVLLCTSSLTAYCWEPFLHLPTTAKCSWWRRSPIQKCWKRQRVWIIPKAVRQIHAVPFLHKGGATTSSSGYCKAANSWALKECIRKITARLACSVHFCLGIFLPSFSYWTLSWSFALTRAEEWLYWVGVAFGDE